MNQTKEYGQVTGTTGLTALLGRPVKHSISPLMHNEAFRLLGLDYVYLCFEVGEEELEPAVRGLKACGIRGFNLTMPNKNRILPLLDDLSPAARLMGAVNTVVNEKGRLIGHNTDGIGYRMALEDAGFSLVGEEATILGAGGAATAIIAQAALDGIKAIHVVLRPTSRFYSRCRDLADQINRTMPCQVDLTDLGDLRSFRNQVEKSRFLINASSVGMSPNEDATLVEDTGFFRKDLVVSDIIYHPKQTRLLREASQAGCPTFNGMYMLLYQGAEAFRLWTGRDMPVEEIKARFFS